MDQQLRSLTILDGLIENAGTRFQRAFADEPLLERLRVCATDSLSDSEVKKKCSILFQQWAVSYKNTPGMERIAALNRQLPKRKKPVTQAQSKVLKETEPNPNEDPFSNDEGEGEGPSQAVTSPKRQRFGSLSSPSTAGPPPDTSSKSSKKSKKDKSGKPRTFNIEREKPQILQAIASSSIASTNLMNALKLIDRENKRVSEDAETLNRFEICKKLRRQILRYIQQIESDQWLGSLINANDSLVEALMAFEILDKSVEDDSDSEGILSDNDEQQQQKAPPKLNWPNQESEANLSKKLAGLHLNKMPPPRPPTTAVNGKSPARNDEDDDDDDSTSETGDGNGDEDEDPFADRNEVHTPKSERPGMTW